MPSTVVHTLGHVLADGPRRHTQAQLEQDLVGNTFLSPGRILSRHTTEKGLQVRRNGWASGCRLAALEEPEPLAMPAEKGLRLHNGQGFAPVKPAREPHQGETGSIRSTAWFDVAFLRQRQLFTQEQVFGCERDG